MVCEIFYNCCRYELGPYRTFTLWSAMEQKGQIRVAIVGSGMAGLVTAYLLNRDVQSRYAVTLFEAASVAISAVLVPGIGPTDTP